MPEKPQKIITEAHDKCVRCGLCLPHCPTYQLNKIESESPRGRIAIANAVVQNSIPLDTNTQKHLDNCLACSACEAMCPANVPYHDLLVNVRQLQNQKNPKQLPWLLNFMLRYPSITLPLQFIYKIYQFSGLAKLFKITKLEKILTLDKYKQFSPTSMQYARFKNFYKAKESKITVGLFLGCIHPFCHSDSIKHAIEILLRLGMNVEIPKSQRCCGAMHLHNGANEQAQKYQTINRSAFAKPDSSYEIVALASGCQQALRQSEINVVDIHQVLLRKTNLVKLRTSLSNLIRTSKILIHTPCTLKNTLNQPSLLFDLLNKAGFENIETVNGFGCCGAAGLNMLENPDTANALAKPLITIIEQKEPDFVVTGNIGCQLHLQNQLHIKGINTRVLLAFELFSSEKRLKP